LTGRERAGIINHMVNSPDALSKTFAALSDPTRRAILERLARGESPVSKLAAPHRMSAPAVSKHLRVLESARLIRRSRVGREHLIRIDPAPLRKARDWMSLYADAWQRQFEALERFLEETASLPAEEKQQAPTQKKRPSAKRKEKS
jgi:DNA-binding transcriptional ArsR family regulator